MQRFSGVLQGLFLTKVGKVLFFLFFLGFVIWLGLGFEGSWLWLASVTFGGLLI